ncbi:MAG: hypothetical protein NZ750_12465 [Anaerolineae bacterium]|nr:hypothetical protein [Anaerolineae bacterium]MDW8171280.1 hypothetical protein [Anaerolineae bacterium]
MIPEGLQAIVEKQEVVPTASAEDLKTRPEAIESTYLYHVRTYLPINRATQAQDDQISVEDFQARLIRQLREGKMPRGYIAANYGYGKTTSGLYVWQKAQDANIVAVPPFTMNRLQDLIEATYGWLHYRLRSIRPNLATLLDQLYQRTINRSLEQIAQTRGLSLAQAEGLYRDNMLLLDLKANDYVTFFEEASRLAQEGGFLGLLILPDEIQQYFRAKEQEAENAIVPFFSMLQLLNSRAASSPFAFGFIMVITLDELAKMRDVYRRTDVLHRMKDLTIDLTTLYDRSFAPRLWDLLAERFDFRAHQTRIADAETLRALGEICARTDISDGPRTAVNVFRRMAQRYLDAEGQIAPYSPIDLVRDFLDERRITFAGNDKLRRAVRRALSDERVRLDYERYAPAICLAAAYPTDGVSRQVQQRYGQEEALSDLMRSAIGDIVKAGALSEGSIMLIGLSEEREQTGWLANVIRDFRFHYRDTLPTTQERAEEAFERLLRERVFTKWKLIESRERSYVINRSLILEGTFDNIKDKYPRRRVHVRLLWEDEPVKDAEVLGDVCIEYRLSLYHHLSEDERRQFVQEPERRDDHNARIHLNLMYSDPALVSPVIQRSMEDVWSPYDLSPLVLLNIYSLISEKLEQNAVPKNDEARIRSGFLPEILDTLTRTMFNPHTKWNLSSGARMTHDVVGYMLETRYPNYRPLVVVQNWSNSLDKYRNALSKLESQAQRQGQVDVEGNKQTIAELFTLSNTGLDSFIKSFSDLIEVRKDFRGKEDGIICFKLHPMEQRIMDWLKASPHTFQVSKGNRTHTLHRLNVAKLMREAASHGYLDEETDALLKLLQERGLAEVTSDGWLSEATHQEVSLDEAKERLDSLSRDLSLFEGVESNQLESLRDDAERRYKPMLQELAKSKSPNPEEVSKLLRTLKTRQRDLENIINDLLNNLRSAVKGLRAPNGPDVERLEDSLRDEAVEYSDQIDAMRISLLDEARDLKKKRDELSQRLQNTRRLILEGQPSYEQIAETMRDLPIYRHKLEELEQSLRAFAKRDADFHQWRTLVTSGKQFLESLKSEAPDEVAEQRRAFDQLSVDIRGEIRSQSPRLNALPLYQPFTKRLDELHRQLNERKNARRRAFIDLHDSQRQTLLQHRIIGQSQWQTINYNAAHPRDSYAQLREQVRRHLVRNLDEGRRAIADRQQSLESLRKAAANLATQARAQAYQQIEAIQEQLNPLAADLPEAEAKLEHSLNDVDSLAPYAEALGQWRQKLGAIHDQVQALQSQIGGQTPTREEREVYDLIQQQRRRGAVDFVALERRYSQTLWTLLRGLYDKDLIRVTVEPVEPEDEA